MPGLQAFALGKMEYIVIAKERNSFLFVRFFILLFDELPEEHYLRLCAFLHVAAFLLTLGEGQVFAGLVQKHLIKKTVRLARDVADNAAADDPRLFPRDGAILELGDDAVGDFPVDIHSRRPSW